MDYLQALTRLATKNGAAESAVTMCLRECELMAGMRTRGTAAGRSSSPARLRLQNSELAATPARLAVEMYSAWWTQCARPVRRAPVATAAPSAQFAR